MIKHNLLKLILLNLIGFGLFFSWYLPENHGFWFTIDSTIFHYFNQHLGSNPTFLHWVAIINNRAFDVVSLLAMGSLFLYFFMKEDPAGRRRLFFMGIVMLICGVALNQIGRVIPVDRPSPTLTFSNIYRVSELTGVPTKDSSSDSFPGDHGLMLLIFSGFILRYFTRWAFAVAILIMVLFSLPRIMIGAHWFTDIYVGSVSLACIGLSWILLTPASDYLIDKIDRLVPGKRSRS